MAYENYLLCLKHIHVWGQSNNYQSRKQVLEELFLLFLNPTAVNRMTKILNVHVIEQNRNSERIIFQVADSILFTKWIKGKNGSRVTAMCRETRGHEELTVSFLIILLLLLHSFGSSTRVSQITRDFWHLPCFSLSQGNISYSHQI